MWVKVIDNEMIWVGEERMNLAPVVAHGLPHPGEDKDAYLARLQRVMASVAIVVKLRTEETTYVTDEECAAWWEGGAS